MKVLSFSAFLCLCSVWAQTPPPAGMMPDLPDTALLCTFDDGAKFTMGDFKRIYDVLPPENQQMALRDRKTFLDQWGFMRKLSAMAEKEKLTVESPTREMLDYHRMMILSQAKLDQALSTMTVEAADIVAYYESHKDKYKQVRVKAIYLAFGDGSAQAGKKSVSEAEALAKVTKLVAAARGGTDFVQLVKENSDDEISRNKDGEFATLRPTDNVPDVIRAAIFGLQSGQISEPVRQQNGFYIFRAEDVTYRPLTQARDEIFTDLKTQRYAKWLEDTNKSTRIIYHNPAFIGAIPMPAPAK